MPSAQVTDPYDINPANLPHQVEEADRISMLGAFRIVGLLAMMCAFIQIICAFLVPKFDDPIWVLSSSPKWNGPAAVLLIGAICFFLPGPASARFATPAFRLAVRIFLGIMGVCYLALAVMLIQASVNRISQLDSGQIEVIEQRQLVYTLVVNQIQNCATREALDALFPAGTFSLGDVQNLSFEEYRGRVLATLAELNQATLESIKNEADDNASQTITYYVRKVIRSGVFAIALLALALAAPRGFPQPLPAHEQPA